MLKRRVPQDLQESCNAVVNVKSVNSSLNSSKESSTSLRTSHSHFYYARRVPSAMYVRVTDLAEP